MNKFVLLTILISLGTSGLFESVTSAQTTTTPIATAAPTLASVTAKGASTSVATTFSGGLQTSGLNSTGEIVGTLASGFGQARWVHGSYGLIERNDGTNFYMLLTPAGSPEGTWSALRPFTINDATGNVTLGTSVKMNSTLNVSGAVTAPSFVGSLTGVATSAEAVKSVGDNVSTTGWYRSNGKVGWFNNTYGGGLWMEDESWIRTYGNKSFYVQGGNFAVSGKVGIGTTSPSASLSVVGNGSFTQAVTAPAFTMTSDSRLKEQVQPLSGELENIVALKPVHFFWNDLARSRGNEDPTGQIGFIAQEVEKIFPEVVRTDGEGYKSVNYAALISPVVQALKEFYAQSQADRLQSQADKLQMQELLKQKDAKISDLETRLEKIETQLNLKSPAGK